MLFHMLKKDMIKRKGVNAILFVFITLATVFLSSSVNNIMVVTSAVDYYMDYASVPDVNIILNSEIEVDIIDEWIEEQKESGKIDAYAYNNMIMMPEKDVHTIVDDEDKVFDGNGASIFLSTTDVDYNNVFDEKGNEFTLNNGEIALSRNTMERNHLELNDQIRIKINDVEKTFTIAMVMKDAAYGSDMMGMIRFIINQDEYAQMSSNNATAFGMYYVTCDDAISFKQDVVNQSFPSIMNIVDRGMYQMLYSFDMIMAGLLTVIGICLILIAMLVLRFTLVFTMEEQNQEIGIMKAIGLRNWGIKKLYLLKYFVLVSCGAFLGVLCSFPVSAIMVQTVSTNMIMESSQANYMINIFCALCVIFVVLLFCYICTRKLNKVSAITAIRGGNDGERYGKRHMISLSKRKRLPVTIYLGFNDIACNMRRYAVLMITFCVSFILITIPLNTINTMKSNEMIKKFAIHDHSKILLNVIELENEGKYNNTVQLKQGLDRVKKEMQEAGYDVKLTTVPLYFFNFEMPKVDNKANIMTLNVYGDERDYFEYSEGSAPLLENEIAFSKLVLQDNGWEIGDVVTTQINGGLQEFIITGTYTDYMQLGRSARLNPVIDCSKEMMFDYNTIMVDFETDQTQEQIKVQMEQQFPQYEWKTTSDYINQNIGGIEVMIDQVLKPMTMMLGGVIMLITWLMVRLFITREKGEIAMLKSAGFKNRNIRFWVMVRMVSVVVISMLISIPLSLLSNQFLLKPIFAIMGADMNIQVEFWNAYIIYPGFLLLVIMLATLLATISIRKINIREMNNLE